MKPSKMIFIPVVAVVLVIGLLELTFGALAFVFPKVDRLLASTPPPAAFPDTRLEYRPNPAYPGHDRNGFRNVNVPDQPQVVTLGDSQTYGTGVSPAAAWPRQLEPLMGHAVYSMAFGGYGPAHSLMLWEEATALSPDVIVEAFYVGNDLYDAYNVVYNKGQLPSLKTAVPRVQARVYTVEQSEPIAPRVARLYAMGAQPVAKPSGEAAIVPTVTPSQWFSEHSRMYGLVTKVWGEGIRWWNNANLPENKWARAKAFADAHADYCQAFDDGQFRTIFTSEYRLIAEDLDDPRIAEGLQISWRAMQRMQASAAAKHIRFVVLLIPTKEAVFRPLWKTPSATYRRLMDNEERVWRLTKEFLTREGIEYLDALPALQAQFQTGVQPYQISFDGHPNDQGHQAIAKLVAAYLTSSKLPPVFPTQVARGR